VKYLVEMCQVVITTQDNDNATPISDAAGRGHTKIADYLKAQVMKMVMGIEFDILPFYAGVRSIIVKFLY